MHRFTTRLLATAAVVAVYGLAVGTFEVDHASAQTGPEPTIPQPCVDCDNADSGIPGNPGLTFANGFACEPATGYGVHIATAHVPAKWAGPVTFYFPAATPQLVVVAPGKTATMSIRAPSGVDVFWVGSISGPGVNRNVNRGPFRCDCDQPPTSSTVPPTVTTVPGTTTGPPNSSSVPGMPTTTPLVGELPATGSTAGTLTFLGVLALGIAAFLLILSRKPEVGE